MKRLEDMSRDELLNLTDEQRSELADLECAYEGIPLLPPRPEKPEIKYPDKDVEVFSVDGHDFTDHTEAQAYVDFVNGLKSQVILDYDWNTGSSEFKYVKSECSKVLNYEKKRVYSAEAFANLKSEITMVKAKEQAYKEQLSEFKSARDERAAIYKKIDEEIGAAWDAKRREDQLFGAYNKYLSLTGDGGIALKLLKDAYKVTDEEEAAVIEKANGLSHEV